MTDLSNDVSMRPKVIAGIATPKAATKGQISALTSLATSFQHFLQGMGTRLGSGFDTLADHEFGGNSGNDGAFRADDEYALRPDDYGDQRSGSSSRGGDDDRSKIQPTEPRDDYRREHGESHHEDRADGGGYEHGDEHAGDQGDQAASGDDRAQASEDADGSQDRDDGNVKTADSETDSPAANDGGNGEDGTAVSVGTDAVSARAGISTQAMNPDLAAIIGGNAHTTDGAASDQGKVSASGGLTTASDNILRAATGNGTQGHGQSQAQTNANPQALDNANLNAALKTEAKDQSGASTHQSQAAGLAKAIGDGTRAQVNVSVTNEAQVLTSRPGQALSPGIILSAEGANAGAGAQDAALNQAAAQGRQEADLSKTPAQTQGQQSQTGASQGQHAKTGLPQAQLAQAGLTQSQQEQVLTQVAAGAKGGIGSAASANASGGTSIAAGGEGSANTGTGAASAAGEAQGTQKSAEAKGANSSRPGSASRSVVEQISVRITKAVLSGNDKITMQLRPVNLGRVEVKMELSQDNRLTVLVIADNRETLELLKNDSRDLQRALQEAGLQTDANDLNFNLRGQEGQDDEAKGSSQDSSASDEEAAGLEDTIIEQPVIASDGSVITNGRIDVRA